MGRQEAWLNGLPLSTINPSIRILDISYASTSLDVSNFQKGFNSGQIILDERRDLYTVTVSFLILEYNTQRRTAILQDIARWAATGGKLECSDRPMQFMTVKCDTLPVLNSALRWTNTISMVFKAYGMPFWQNDDVIRYKVAGTSQVIQAFDNGIIDGYPEVELTVSSGTLTTVTLSCDETGTSMTFSGLSIGAGGTFVLTHDPETWLLQVTGAGQSVYSKRTADSSDELRTKAGVRNTIRVQTDASVTGQIYIRGLVV